MPLHKISLKIKQQDWSGTTGTSCLHMCECDYSVQNSHKAIVLIEFTVVYTHTRFYVSLLGLTVTREGKKKKTNQVVFLAEPETPGF